MIVTRRIHCILDREPDSYHQPTTPAISVHAVNLGFECESDTASQADESEARELFARFLASARSFVFHVYALDGDSFRHVEMAAALRQDMPGAPADIMAWLDDQPRAGRFWSEPVRDLAADLHTTTDQSQARATHLLRGSQSWSAPVAHQFGLTRLVEVGQDLSAPSIILPIQAGIDPPPELPATALTVDGQAGALWSVAFDSGGLGMAECWVSQLQASAPMPAMLDSDGYLMHRPGAEDTRRVLDWFERAV